MNQHRSLRHQYDLYVEREIEDYKDAVPRSVLLGIGDEAVKSLAAQSQMALTELVLWEEVDRIIKHRLGLPDFRLWRRRQHKLLAKYRTPEHWGLEPDAAVVRAIHPTPESHVLLAGVGMPAAATLYLAAHGCEVTAVAQDEDAVERVMQAAEAAGLTERVHSTGAALGQWVPNTPLAAVVCAPSAFAGLSLDERAQLFTRLQEATAGGGVHLLETVTPGGLFVTLDELRSRYRGWDVSEDLATAARTFVARKSSV
jgi:hypothetical protein